MKKTYILFVFCLFIVVLNAIAQDDGDKRPSITAKELNSIDVIGKLGIPLGKAVQIEAIIISGDSLRMKGYAGHYLLKILSINGNEFNVPPTMRFTVFGLVETQIANNQFALYKLKKHKEAKRLSSVEIKELEEGYVGLRVKLVAYETGGFSGIPEFNIHPDDPPGILPNWQDRPFHFSTGLIVLKQYE